MPTPPKIQFEVKDDEKSETQHQLSTKKVCANLMRSIPHYVPEPSFPSRLAPNKKDASKDEELLEVFKKEQINLSLLGAIQQISRNAKFLKELCANKRKAKGEEK